MLPEAVLKKASSEMLDVNGTGQSAMEMSHRSAHFLPIIEKAEANLRALMNIPNDYAVLFLQGGAWTQFSMVPINLAGVEAGAERKNAVFIDTGIWAAKMGGEAAKYVNMRCGASSKAEGYTFIPPAPPPAPSDVFYAICYNNTIMGSAWKTPPETGAVPLVADISSCILSAPLDVSRFGVLFAGAQKNLGPAGCTLVIIKKELTGKAPSWTPEMLRYDTHLKEKSLFNTPPCYSIYIIGLVLEWLLEQGGVAEIHRRNIEKAGLLYDYIDNSRFYKAPVQKESRSLMNVRFTIREDNGENAKY
jgi:phosphoserine aminotransferase